MHTRAEVIEGKRCDWFDHQCPGCAKMAFAYSDIIAELFKGNDYILLCQDETCRFYFWAMGVWDQWGGDAAEIDFNALKEEAT